MLLLLLVRPKRELDMATQNFAGSRKQETLQEVDQSHNPVDCYSACDYLGDNDEYSDSRDERSDQDYSEDDSCRSGDECSDQDYSEDEYNPRESYDNRDEYSDSRDKYSPRESYVSTGPYPGDSYISGFTGKIRIRRSPRTADAEGSSDGKTSNLKYCTNQGAHKRSKVRVKLDSKGYRYSLCDSCLDAVIEKKREEDEKCRNIHRFTEKCKNLFQKNLPYMEYLDEYSRLATECQVCIYLTSKVCETCSVIVDVPKGCSPTNFHKCIICDYCKGPIVYMNNRDKGMCEKCMEIYCPK